MNADIRFSELKDLFRHKWDIHQSLSDYPLDEATPEEADYVTEDLESTESDIAELEYELIAEYGSYVYDYMMREFFEEHDRQELAKAAVEQYA